MLGEEKDIVYLQHIRDAIQEIRVIVGGRDVQSVMRSHEVYYSVLYLMVVIGEASGKLSPEFKAKWNIVPWDKVKGMRNILIHEYAGVSFEVVWKTVQDRLPELERVVEQAITDNERK